MRVSFLCLLLMVGACEASAASSLPVHQLMDDFGVQLPKEHKLAPALTLPQLGGGKLRLSDERGKVVLLHFWASWCVACRHEMPQIEALSQHYQGAGLVVLAVNVDRGGKELVQNFVQEYHLSFPVLLDLEGNVRNRYAVRALPMTYVIGRDGKMIGRVFGERDWSSSAAFRMLDKLL